MSPPAGATATHIAYDSVTTGLLYDEDGYKKKIETGESGHVFDLAAQYLSADPSSVIHDQPKESSSRGRRTPAGANELTTQQGDIS